MKKLLILLIAIMGFINVNHVFSAMEYDMIGNLTYSPDGKNFAYLAQNYGGKLNLVVDGVIVREFPNEYGSPGNETGSPSTFLRYAPDGKTLALIGLNKVFLFPSGEEIDIALTYSSNLPNVENHPNFIFSPTGSGFAYVLWNGDPTDTKNNFNAYIIKDGQPIAKEKNFGSIGAIHYSQDGKNIFYIAVPQEYSGSNYTPQAPRYMKNETILAQPASTLIVPSLDGDHFAYVNEYFSGVSIIKDGVDIIKNARFGVKFSQITKMAYSNDGKRFAYSASNSDNWFNVYLVLDGKIKKIPSRGSIGNLIFSPNGNSFSYASQELLIKDGKKIPAVNGIVYSPVNNGFIYITSNARSYILSSISINGKKKIMSARIPTYSPDGKKVSYIKHRPSYKGDTLGKQRVETIAVAE